MAPGLGKFFMLIKGQLCIYLSTQSVLKNQKVVMALNDGHVIFFHWFLLLLVGKQQGETIGFYILRQL